MLLFLLQNKVAQAIFLSFLSLLGGIYLGHNYTKNGYEAQIAKQKASTAQEIISEQTKAQKAAAGFISKIREEQLKSSLYQADARLVLGDSLVGGGCYLPYGFIRLFNASATGDQTAKSSSDNIASPIDLTALLSTIIENHGKYREAARQIEALNE